MQKDDQGHPGGRIPKEILEQLYGMSWATSNKGVAWQPPTDVYETAEDIVVRVEIAGVAIENVRIAYADRVLSITGERKDPAPKVGYHRMEILYGPFQTEVLVPRRVDSDKITAEYRNGMLTLRLPKASPIRVRVENSTSHEPDIEQ